MTGSDVAHEQLLQEMERLRRRVAELEESEAVLLEERRRLEESEEKYRAILDNIEIGISLLSPNLEIVDINRIFKGFFPHVEPSSGQICYEQYNDPPGTGPCSCCPTILALRDGESHEITTATPAGSDVRNYRIVSSPIRDSEGRIQYIVEMVQDVTRLMRSRTTLDRVILEWERTFNSIPDLIMVLDLEHRILRANSAMLKVLEMTEEEMKGRHCFEIMHGRDAPLVSCPYNLLIADGEERSAEVVEPRFGATYEVRVSPFVDSEGRVMGSVHFARDITERKKSDEALRRSEEKYRTIFEESFDGLFITSPGGKILDMNRKGVTMFGYDTKEEVLRLDLQRDVYAFPPDRERILAMVGEQGTAEYEVVVKKKNGELMDTYCSLTAVKNGKGEITSYRGIIRDITERKKADAALAAASIHNRSLIEASLDPLVTVSAEGKITDVNAATEKVTGYSRHDLIGTEFSRYFTDTEKARSVYAEAFKHGAVKDRELDLRHRDGHLTPVVYNASVYRGASGEIAGLFAAARDIGLRKQVEEKNLWLASIVESSDDAVIGTSPDGVITSWNRGAERTFGYREDETIGRPMSLLAPAARHGEVFRFHELLRRGEHVEHYETVRRRKDGSEIDVSLTISPIRNMAGRIIGASTIARDMTQQKSLQRQLLQAQKIEALGTLAGGIAHDFNNILGIIMGFAEIAAFDLGEGSEPRQSIDEILRAARRAKDLVAQILTFSRRADQERKPLSLEPLIKEALRLLRASLPASVEIRQEIELSGEDDLVRADATQVQQVLMNLATNAAHAMRESGGVLRVSLSSERFDATSAARPVDLAPGRYAILSVEDTGHGMNRMTIDRIFDPYFTTKGPGEGTGLGLAVVHGIAKSGGGTVTVESEPGKGSVFRVYFPLLKDGESTNDAPLVRIPTGSGRVLLVDDEVLLVDVVGRMLRRLGYEVTAVTNSVDALSLFRGGPQNYDLVITDYSMPKMSGTDLAAAIMEARKDIPVILTTGFNERISGMSIKDMGIRALMMKPVSLGELGRLVHQVLNAEGGRLLS